MGWHFEEIKVAVAEGEEIEEATLRASLRRRVGGPKEQKATSEGRKSGSCPLSRSLTLSLSQRRSPGPR